MRVLIIDTIQYSSTCYREAAISSTYYVLAVSAVWFQHFVCNCRVQLVDQVHRELQDSQERGYGFYICVAMCFCADIAQLLHVSENGWL